MADIKKYEGDDVDVTWDQRLCIHIGECGRAQGDLFVGGRDPWCDPNLVQGADDVVDVVERCPTGALVHLRKDGVRETVPAANTVLVSNHGPLYVRGDLEIDGAADDMEGVKTRAALCRCGQSSRKPFCDNSHEKSGFQDRGAVGDSGRGFDEPGGKLEVKRAKNGPLIVSGNLTILSSSGREAWRGKRAALCRCGASTNKPFCDGTHTAIGFEAD